MRRSSDERIIDIQWATKRYPDLQPYLEIHRGVIEAQDALRRSAKKGTLGDWDERTLRKLQSKAQEAQQPLIRYLKLSMIDEEEMRTVAIQIVDVLIQHKTQGSLEALRQKLTSGVLRIRDLLGVVSEGIDGEIVKIARTMQVEQRLLVFLAHMLIQPWAERVASDIDRSFLDRWAQSVCPVCGVKPVVERTIGGKRFLSCTLCSLRFPADPFLCVFCGNSDPYTLKSLVPDDNPAQRVDYCEKCRRYTKVIVKQRLKEELPLWLEDLLTLDLDFMAKSADLVRDWPDGATPTEAQQVW